MKQLKFSLNLLQITFENVRFNTKSGFQSSAAISYTVSVKIQMK